MKILWMVAVAFMAATRLFAAEHYPVRLEVSVEDASLKSRVYSLISRELRKLGDVEVSDAPVPVFTLKVIGFTSNRASDNLLTGYVFASIVTHPVLLSSNADEKLWQTLYSAKPEEYLISHLYMDGTSKLEETCALIVANFDTDQMEPERKFIAAIAAEREKQQNGAPQKGGKWTKN